MYIMKFRGRNQFWGQRTHSFSVVFGITRVEEVKENRGGRSFRRGRNTIVSVGRRGIVMLKGEKG